MTTTLEDQALCTSQDPYLYLLRTTPARTVCPNFYLLDHARGCNFNCSYCFLRDTEYGRKERRIFTDTERLFKELGEWVEQDGLETYLANTGNMTDSLSFEGERPIWGELIEFMREKAEKRGRPHCLLAVTKSGLDNCEAFLRHAPCKNIIISFSINSPEAAAAHEAGAAPSGQRLEAARKLKALGWRVRVRLDPMIDGYDYGWLINQVRKMAPERVTLGTLRADPTLLPEVGDVSIFSALEAPEEGSIGRYPRATRMRLYRGAIEGLGRGISIGLCEETQDVWEELGLDVVNKTCNCNPL